MSPSREHPAADPSPTDPGGRTGDAHREPAVGERAGDPLASQIGGQGFGIGAIAPATNLGAEISADELLTWFEAPSSDEPAGDAGEPRTAFTGGRLLGGATTLPAVLQPPGVRRRVALHRYGVAPFVQPSARRSRRKRRRDYRQLGFVELTPEPLRLRHRILPRTVLGTSLMLAALGVGAAFSGAAFYAYYDWRASESEAQSLAFAQGFEQTFTGAQEQLQRTRDDAVGEVTASLEPLRAWAEDANAVTELPAKVGGGVFLVRTLDTAGKPSVGSAFVVSSSATESLLLTSYQVVAALAAKPGPALTVEKGKDSFSAELWAWDPARDLALLKTTRGGLPQLDWAPDDARARTAGKRVYAVSGFGGQGATAAPGLAIDASAAGIRHDTPLGPEFRGAPLTNGAGQVLGVVSTAYSPTGVDPGALTFAPFITAACDKLLRCPASVTATSAPPAAPAGKPTPTTP